ncbi:Molybdopterin molybdenumtransferase [Planctomycetes bacterium MalM25]|nr:Molybdopterin molybdenumtransferase [Planctomycetes bacterium MalM25]
MNDHRQALADLLARIGPVGAEKRAPATDLLGGRVLSEPLRLDRDSPACDVSAMDGFAVRLAELREQPLPIRGECRIGQPPEPLPPGVVRRIYTGSPLPPAADTVVRLERGEVDQERLALLPEAELTEGADIRCGGENARAGDQVLAAGRQLTPAAIGALATIGPPSVEVFRPLRVAVLTTGDELVRAEEPPSELPSWRLRDSNGPVLSSMFTPLPWVADVSREHAVDTLEALNEKLGKMAASADIVILTGGVSKGAYDFVPDAVRGLGGEIIFHRIAARPGQPMLGAMVGVTPVLGLPGNPLSVLCTARRMVAPILRKRAGFDTPDPPATMVKLEAWSGKPQKVAWWRPVERAAEGLVRLVPLRGSGDVCGPASSDGFIEAPPGSDGVGPYAFYPWTI